VALRIEAAAARFDVAEPVDVDLDEARVFATAAA
jgi:hypothetical protein